ncbi:MAG: stage V sporulation protein AD [Clostridia bacterium]|nr:stage V sporulation protein AD [Clostridia bacterium]
MSALLAGPRPAARRVGAGTWTFPSRPRLVRWASVVGRLEGEGPLAAGFDEGGRGRRRGPPRGAAAAAAGGRRAARRALDGLKGGPPELHLGGDLLDQNTPTHFAARDLDIPAFGLFSACATLTAGLAEAALAVDGGFCRRVLVTVSSHHETAERQYRFPIEFGHQRPATAQWTATAAAAFVVAGAEEGGADGVAIASATPGRVIDYGISDPYDMGSAMAPAAADTIERHLRDTGRSPRDYDAIVTGDLAEVGSELLRILLGERGIELGDRHEDCGLLLYDRRRHDVHAGGSGAGQCAAVFAARHLPALRAGRLRRVLLVATGALLSPTTYRQGESIPAVAHAVAFESGAPEAG